MALATHIAAWEFVAAELGLTIDRRTPGIGVWPTHMSGTVDGFDLKVWTYDVSHSGEYGEDYSTYMDYAVEFSSPIGPVGFLAIARGRGWQGPYRLLEAILGRSRRVGRWALSADHRDELEAWLTPERISAFETMLWDWKATQLELRLSTKGIRTPIVARCRDTLAAARALAN